MRVSAFFALSFSMPYDFYFQCLRSIAPFLHDYTVIFKLHIIMLITTAAAPTSTRNRMKWTFDAIYVDLSFCECTHFFVKQVGKASHHKYGKSGTIVNSMNRKKETVTINFEKLKHKRIKNYRSRRGVESHNYMA